MSGPDLAGSFTVGAAGGGAADEEVDDVRMDLDDLADLDGLDGPDDGADVSMDEE
ncbi:hypothetical protein KC356_g8922, partial [Hortaea werneckii]